MVDTFYAWCVAVFFWKQASSHTEALYPMLKIKCLDKASALFVARDIKCRFYFYYWSHQCGKVWGASFKGVHPERANVCLKWSQGYKRLSISDIGRAKANG